VAGILCKGTKCETECGGLQNENIYPNSTQKMTRFNLVHLLRTVHVLNSVATIKS